jgi:hypothetical protein
MARPVSDFGPTWLTMTNALIFGNTVSECGGGILNTYWIWPDSTPPEAATLNPDANLTLVTATLYANRAGLLGGGISNGSNTTAVDVWLGGNHAGMGGGVSSSSASVLSFLWYYLICGYSGAPIADAPAFAPLEQGAPLPFPQQVPYGPEGRVTLVNAVFSGNQSHGLEDAGGLPLPVGSGAGVAC